MQGNLGLLKSALSKGLFHLLSANFLIQFASFGLVLLLTKYLTPVEVGDLKILQAYIAFFIVVGAFGYNSAILKYASENVGNELKQARFDHSFRRVCFFSVLSFLLVVALFYFTVLPARPTLYPYAYFYASVVLFAPLSFLCLSYLQARKEVKLAATLQLFVRLIFVVVIFISAWFFGFSGVIFSLVISYFVGLVIYLPIIYKRRIAVENSSVVEPSIDRYSLFIFGGAILTIISQNLDIYILDYLNVSSRHIGTYTVATLVFLSGTVITGTIQTVVTPYFSEKQDDKLWVKNKAYFYQKKIIYFSMPIAFLLAIFSYFFVYYYLGVEYEDSFGLSLILIVKYLLWSSFCIFGAVLFSIGIVWEGLLIAMLILAFNSVASVFLYNRMGLTGIALSQVFSSLLQLVLVVYLFRWKTKIV